jgi:hypothetical protein
MDELPSPFSKAFDDLTTTERLDVRMLHYSMIDKLRGTLYFNTLTSIAPGFLLQFKSFYRNKLCMYGYSIKLTLFRTPNSTLVEFNTLHAMENVHAQTKLESLKIFGNNGECHPEQFFV